jgi:hypothetical protein
MRLRCSQRKHPKKLRPGKQSKKERIFAFQDRKKGTAVGVATFELRGGPELTYLLASLRNELASRLVVAQKNWDETVEWWGYRLQEMRPPIDLRVLAAAHCLELRSLLERVEVLILKDICPRGGAAE